MKQNGTVLKAVILAVSLSAAIGIAGVAGAQQYYSGGPNGYGPGWMMGPGMMGPGMMGGWMGPGMMGYGGCGYGPARMMGPGMMGYGYGRWGYYNHPPRSGLDLTVGQVKLYLQRWIDASGNSHLKVGSVVAKDAKIIIAQIVTDKDAPVERLSVNRHTGRYEPIAIK